MSINSISSISSISDQKLLLLAKRFGRNALLWRRKFIGLLPEINKRRLYEKKGYESIFVFAKKLAGLSEEQVRRALNLERRFESFPALRKVFVNGEVSVNKLARVVSIATFENEGERLKIFPKRPWRLLFVTRSLRGPAVEMKVEMKVKMAFASRKMRVNLCPGTDLLMART